MHLGVVVVAKDLVLFGLTGKTMKRFVAKPSDRAAVVQQLAEWAGGSLERTTGYSGSMTARASSCCLTRTPWPR